jgi:hypothetical protein
MAGSRTFSTEASKALVDAYLAQPEGKRDLRKVLEEAKGGRLVDPAEIRWTLNSLPAPQYVPVDPHIQAEIATMSKSQAYELLRQDPRHQPTTTETSRQLTEENLELARDIIAHERSKPAYKRNVPLLKKAQSLIGQVEWQQREMDRRDREKGPPADGNGLAGLLD